MDDRETVLDDRILHMDREELEDWISMYLTYESEDVDYPPTRGEKREAKQQRDRQGMVKHSAPNVRPKNFLKVKKP